ncbi:Uu.00g111210.m01.CDS01 [Anthostomella pinea]|uniref:Uu.00g111210.m01.CDS01 n=1 Tax=Anthostomella pinea TaxID=933095 RepID=A0AAI8VEY6_9PEZI|nr:Uu.00g111210.m01.CDS01 [Anthostomella pinea]
MGAVDRVQTKFGHKPVTDITDGRWLDVKVKLHVLSMLHLSDNDSTSFDVAFSFAVVAVIGAVCGSCSILDLPTDVFTMIFEHAAEAPKLNAHVMRLKHRLHLWMDHLDEAHCGDVASDIRIRQQPHGGHLPAPHTHEPYSDSDPNGITSFRWSSRLCRQYQILSLRESKYLKRLDKTPGRGNVVLRRLITNDGKADED